MKTKAVFSYQDYNEAGKLIAELRYQQSYEDGPHISAAWLLLRSIGQHLQGWAMQSLLTER